MVPTPGIELGWCALVLLAAIKVAILLLLDFYVVEVASLVVF